LCNGASLLHCVDSAGPSFVRDLPSSDQASSEGPALIPIVGNNTERGGESVLSNSFQYTIQIYTLNYSSDIGD